MFRSILGRLIHKVAFVIPGAHHGGKQEPVTDGWAAVCVNPSLKRKPDKGRWVVICPFPIARDGNVQIQESFGQHHR